MTKTASILVPVDGSAQAMHALDMAMDFAASLSAELVICHVVDLAQAAAMAGGQAQLVPGCLKELENEGKSLLEAALARAGGRVPASIRLAEGVVPEQIDRLAAEIHPYFIVIGTHGRSGFNRLVMGSVAEHVVRAASVPVMVIPPRLEHAA